MKTYEPGFFITDCDPYDAAFNDILCGTLQLGDRVRIWDSDSCYFWIGVAERYWGQPSIRLLRKAKVQEWAWQRRLASASSCATTRT